MRDKVLTWMHAQEMTQPGDTVVCAVSGGADSVCMLHVLLSLRDTLGITVEAAHFNHHLRGKESDRDEAFVRQLCETLGVHLYVDGGDVQSRAARTHESMEEAARKLRYAFFSSLPGLIATAHTQDDNLETVLLNLTRGTGLTGLCGIPPKRENLIRPLLPCSRAEIEDYLEKNGLSYVTDSSNLLPDVRRSRPRRRCKARACRTDCDAACFAHIRTPCAPAPCGCFCQISTRRSCHRRTLTRSTVCCSPTARPHLSACQVERQRGGTMTACIYVPRLPFLALLPFSCCPASHASCRMLASVSAAGSKKILPKSKIPSPHLP